MRSTLLGLILVTGAVFAGPEHEHTDNACLDGPIEQFGRYVGDWKITDQQRSQDGTSWSPGAGARWIFECVGHGLAVQDYWRPNTGGFGTNLRTYNASTDAWEIVWTAKGQQGLTHISARPNADGDIVMDILKPEQPQPRRIIFFTPDDGGWDWVMQWSLDNRETWIDVYRIRATPWQDD